MIKFFKNMFNTQVDPALAKAIEKNALLLDVRTEMEFAEGSIKGAVNIPLHAISSRIQTLPTNQPIIVFCRSGNRSKMAVELLRQYKVKEAVDGGSIHNVQKFY